MTQIVLTPVSARTNEVAVERVLARLVVGCRSLSAVQLGVSVGHWLPRSRAPVLDATLLGLVVASALCSCTLMLRAGTPRRPIPVAADIAVGLLALSCLPWLIGAADVTSWANWAYPITLFSASSAGACFRFRTAGVITMVLAGAYLLEARHLGPALDVSTLAANACSYPLFTIAAFMLSRLLRRLGRLADNGADAQAELAALQAGEIVRDQVRPLVHAYDNVVAGVTDERMPTEVRQAFVRDGLRLRVRARAFLEGSDSAVIVPDELRRLGESAGRPLVSVDTNRWGVALERETARALLDAVDESVLNARKHARASHVSVTALSDMRSWTVTVVDDGTGFSEVPETSSHPAGHGLAMLRGPRLARLGITCTILSLPEGGTIVTLSGTR